MLNRGQGRAARPLLSHSQQAGPAQHRDLEKTPWKDACEPSWWRTPERTPGPLPACWEAGKSWTKENRRGSQSRRRRPTGTQEAADPTRGRSENTNLDSPCHHGWERLCDGADVALAWPGCRWPAWKGLATQRQGGSASCSRPRQKDTCQESYWAKLHFGWNPANTWSPGKARKRNDDKNADGWGCGWLLFVTQQVICFSSH